MKKIGKLQLGRETVRLLNRSAPRSTRAMGMSYSVDCYPPVSASCRCVSYEVNCYEPDTVSTTV